MMTSALALVALLAPVAQDPPSPATVTWEDLAAVSATGDAIVARLGRLAVPTDHAKPDGPQLELAFAVYPSTAAQPGAPIYFLVGGPGASATEFALEFTTQPLFDLRAYGDVIALDQRGTGRSRPSIADAPSFAFELPLDAPSTRASLAEAHAAAALACVRHWAAEGVDPSAFTTAQSAEDLERVRRALGHDRIVLYGVSYGTHLGLEYLRRHGAHVERALLSRVEGPDDTYKLPSNALAALEAIHARVAADPRFRATMPDFLGALRTLSAALAEQPVRASVPQRGGAPLEVVLGPHDLQLVVASTLGDSRGQAFLPALVEAATRGDFAALGHFARGERGGEVSNAMGILMDCASGASAERRARSAREAVDPRFVVGPALDAPYLLEVSRMLAGPDVGEALRAPFVCRKPVLFVSGALDARTPPANVAALGKRFPRSSHIVYTNTAHDTRELEFADACAPLHTFLRGEPVASGTIELPPLPLMAPRP